MTPPIVVDDTSDAYDVFLEKFLRTMWGDRYGAVEADKVMHALDAAGLPDLIKRAEANPSEATCCGMPLKPNEDGLPVAICPKCKTWYRLDTSRSHEGNTDG